MGAAPHWGRFCVARAGLVGALLGLAVLAGGAGGTPDYPADITPPPGTRYPCALTALPRDLPGVPASDRLFINHVYSMILKATQAKLVLLKALEGDAGLDVALERYLAATATARARLAAETPPEGLEPFAADVVGALDLQVSFFRSGVKARADGASVAQLFQNPDGRRASALLISAWGRMQRRYPGWSPEVRDSIYHHLCALDLF
jgi:hypothetical protein